MRCRSVLTRVDALRTGELPAGDATEVREHLRTCRSCDESSHDVTSLASMVKTLAVAPPRSCRDAVCEQIHDSFDRLETDFGAVWVAFNDGGLRMIFSGGDEAAFRSRYAERYAKPIERAAIPQRLREQVIAALEGRGVDTPKVDFAEVDGLEKAVLQTLTKIPRGEVRTYGWVARQVGRPKAARAVGTICANNVLPYVVPCHRVVPSAGGVGQYLFGSKAKRELLRREGVDVDKLEELSREGVRYIGSRTTKIVCFPTCKDARRIREENRVPFHGQDEATAKGFRPCRRCQPFAA